MKYRDQRLANQIQESVSEIINRELKESPGTFWSVTFVKLTKDLKFATIYYSVYGSNEEKSKTAEFFEAHKIQIRKLLGKKIRIRFLPEISFEYDGSLEQGEKIEKLLKGLKDKGEI